METKLTKDEKCLLLRYARSAIELAVVGRDLPDLDYEQFTPILREFGASFVTLTTKPTGQLRGCIGTLIPYQPLIDDVREHAVAAALQDYRFSPVVRFEVPQLKIEISRLTTPSLLNYTKPENLVKQITPGVDGVVIQDGKMRATFLPQVWDKIPTVDLFLSELCYKMGANKDLWLSKKLSVSVYQVEEFEED